MVLKEMEFSNPKLMARLSVRMKKLIKAPVVVRLKSGRSLYMPSPLIKTFPGSLLVPMAWLTSCLKDITVVVVRGVKIENKK